MTLKAGFVQVSNEHEPIIDFRHGLPLHVASGDVVEGASHGTALIFHLADIMQAHVPLVPGTAEGMCEAANLIMSL
jgi:hypothetical protein